ncbi:hypothetical protein [Syntrophobacter fumaroxidans]|uniref:hypothetical protein n=1 Tax=Syntrophobacter fumaroxidans TaxID=119484 RepID=UPI0002FFCCEB|nr:hypothetical protein [Syntrophobacter fumaroxidans]HOI95066.1 hypothetical protein [Syntrophobacter fumaroxidans]
MAASGRFGKYGDLKRKAKLRANVKLDSDRVKMAFTSRRAKTPGQHTTGGGGK